MIKSSLHIVFTFLTLLACATKGVCQYKSVTGSKFAAFLCATLPETMNATCDSIYTPESFMVNGTLDFNSLDIERIGSINSYTGIDTIIGYNNDISWMPSIFPSVDYVDLSNNKIKFFESDFPFLQPATDLSYFDVSNNLLPKVPDLTLAASVLRYYNVSHNNLDTLPDFSSYTQLEYINVEGNRLSFDELISLANHPNFDADSFILFPQDNKQFLVNTLSVIEEEDLSFKIVDADSVQGTSYQWFKDGVPFQLNSSGELTIEGIALTDSGAYTLQVTNNHPNLVNVIIDYNIPLEINIIPTIQHLSRRVATDCESHTVTLDTNELQQLTKGAEYTLIDSITGISIVLGSNIFETKEEGTYDLVQIINGEVIQHVDDWVELPSLLGCADDVVSPNGDGRGDFYALDQEGPIQIFSKSGDLINLLEGPTVWDATASDGNTVEPGLYLIHFEDGSYKTISILY